jgi:hypothetical protein
MSRESVLLLMSARESREHIILHFALVCQSRFSPHKTCLWAKFGMQFASRPHTPQSASDTCAMRAALEHLPLIFKSRSTLMTCKIGQLTAAARSLGHTLRSLWPLFCQRRHRANLIICFKHLHGWVMRENGETYMLVVKCCQNGFSSGCSILVDAFGRLFPRLLLLPIFSSLAIYARVGF